MGAMTEFYTPSGYGESEVLEKRSRFLGHLRPVSTEEEAKAFLLEIKKQYHDARHNCWCYRIYDGPERFSDDGEPQGSAGMPMMEVFRRENISNFICVVTRYFGGVLLGTGGLSRAYSEAAKEAVRAAGLTANGKWLEMRFSCPYSMLDRCRNELMDAGAVIQALDYSSDVNIVAQLPHNAASHVINRLTELSSGRVVPVLGDTVLMSAKSRK